MENSKRLKLFSFVLALAIIVGYLSVFVGVQTVFADTDSYYSGITATGGQALLGQLHDLITTTHKKYTSYNDCSSPSIIKKTDPGTNGNVREFYTQDNISSTWGSGAIGTWNREHVWCQSLSNGLWGTSGGGSDLHHIRPAETGLNSARGNNKFGIVSDGNPAYNKDSKNVGGYISGNVFEPLDKVKGDVARIVMYVYTHYNTYSNVGGTTNGSRSSGFGNLKYTMVVSERNEDAAIRMLLEWNKSDPVDDVERTRNEEVFKIQGNRNPFIDDETYAEKIWSDQAVEVELESLTVSPKQTDISIGQSKKLTVTATPSGADNRVNWSSSNTNVATVSSSGIVTAKAEGTCVITATSIKNSGISAIATINVTKSSGTIGDVGVIEITQASFELTSGYGFKYWQSGGIGGMAYIYGGSTEYPPSGMQFNVSKDSYYLASNVALPGAIKSVTVKMVNGKAERPWKLLTSDTPYGEVAGKPTNGNDRGIKTVTSEGVTWEVDSDDVYFALTYEYNATAGASYIESIIIEYGKGGSGETANADAFIAAVDKISSEKNTEAKFNAIKSAMNEYKALDETQKQSDDVKAAYATLQTAISEYNSYVSDINNASQSAANVLAGAAIAFSALAAAILAVIKFLF